MKAVRFDLQKLEQLLNSATSQRERKMYQALLEKARTQSAQMSAAPKPTHSTEKAAQNPQKSINQAQTETKAQTTNKKEKTSQQPTATKASSQSPGFTTLVEEFPQTPNASAPKPKPQPQKATKAAGRRAKVQSLALLNRLLKQFQSA